MKSEDLELIKSLTPDRIAQTSDPEIIYGLLGIIESAFSEIAELRQEYQSLRDEINRLKGEKGKPEIRKNGGNPGISLLKTNVKVPIKKYQKVGLHVIIKFISTGKKFAQFSKKSFQKMQYSKGILPS